MAHRIALITDSTCDIPHEWREQYEIEVVPLTIVWGNQQYQDGIDLTPEEFYRRLPLETIHPTTSQPAPRLFLEAFKRAAEKGAEVALVYTISSAMSGTIESARTAAHESPIPVRIVDGLNNSMGLGWQVIAAARAREAGADLDEMIAASEKVRVNMVYYISLNTVDYLARGGRIGSAVRFVGSILNIKPLITVNPETGTVAPSIPARSRSAAIEGVVKEFFKHVSSTSNLHITVLHNAALDEAKELADRVMREYNPKELFISIVSPILGVHTGPKAIALCGYSED
jgi:DegV family protein with EDD domain